MACQLANEIRTARKKIFAGNREHSLESECYFSSRLLLLPISFLSLIFMVKPLVLVVVDAAAALHCCFTKNVDFRFIYLSFFCDQMKYSWNYFGVQQKPDSIDVSQFSGQSIIHIYFLCAYSVSSFVTLLSSSSMFSLARSLFTLYTNRFDFFVDCLFAFVDALEAKWS